MEHLGYLLNNRKLLLLVLELGKSKIQVNVISGKVSDSVEGHLCLYLHMAGGKRAYGGFFLKAYKRSEGGAQMVPIQNIIVLGICFND